MKNVIYPSRIKKDNLGDILINVLLIRELSKTGKVFLDGDIGEAKDLLSKNNKYGTNIILKKNVNKFDGFPLIRWFRMANLIPNISYVFDPPGHYTQGKNTLKFLLKTLKYSLRAYFLKPLGIRVIRLGVTMGPFSDKGWTLQKMLSKFYYNISVRDSKNFSEVNKVGLKNTAFIDDLAFLYKPQDFFDTTLLKNNNKKVVLSFRGNIEGAAIDRHYVNSIINSLGSFLDHDTEYVLCYQVKEDYEVIKIIYDHFRSDYKFEILENQLSFYEAIKLYFTSNLIITNRLHVALLSMLNETPALVVTDTVKHHKLVNVYKDLCLESFLFDVSNTDPKHISESTIRKAMSNFSKLSTQKRASISNSIKKVTR